MPKALLLSALIFVSCMPTTAPTTSSSPPVASSTADSTSTNEAPTQSPGAHSPSFAPPTTAPQAGGIVAEALGSLSGNWVFFTRRISLLRPAVASLEVWGIPANGSPRLAFSYDVPTGGVPEATFDNNPYLRRQFSPDGRQIVVSTNAGLAIVDLASGRVRSLGALGQFPSWSKEGSSIAYLATTSHPDPQMAIQERSIWVVAAGGGTPREIVGIGYSTIAPEWSADGSLLLAQLRDGVGLVDVASAREITGGRLPFALEITGAHWRANGSEVAIALIRRDDTQVISYDHSARITHFLAQYPRPFDPTPCRCPQGLVPRDPRWNPASAAEMLFVLVDEMTGRAQPTILDTQSGRASKLPMDAAEATWSSDGEQIVYIARNQAGGGALRVYDRATGVDRELVPAQTNSAHLSVASVAY